MRSFAITSKEWRRWWRLRRYRPRPAARDFIKVALLAALIVLWLSTLHAAIRITSQPDADHEALAQKLADTEIMLITCLNGGHPFHTKEQLDSGQIVRVYAECGKPKYHIY